MLLSLCVDLISAPAVAHSVDGACSPKGSGFDGAWTIAPNTMDNTFFSDMLKGQLGWGVQQLPAAAQLYQWCASAARCRSDACGS